MTHDAGTNTFEIDTIHVDDRPLDRPMEALRLLKRGYSLPEIADRLPNQAHGLNGSTGVSDAVALATLRDGLRAVVFNVLMGERSHRVPDDLWPPEEVRAAIRAARKKPNHSTSRRILREWLEGEARLLGPASPP